ncbi:hypothetical protein DPMN_125589 [Dreissena polymorpha]|uniref:Uncharacterized protein n=1 Tax=Dreissena polymorpha TaxID=45954 RepID=A0A9D4GVP8_DREPO|nr:hypothetical protein DPMN_125589 [Dreissena polymorpha]
MLKPRIMKLHRYIDHDWQMTPINFQVTRLKVKVTVTNNVSTQWLLVQLTAHMEGMHSPGIASIHKKTGALPECHRHSPGLRRGITGDDRGVAVALPGSDAGIDTVSAGGVTVYRGSAGTLPAFTGLLPATTGSMPGRCRLSPGTTGDNRGLTEITVASPG